MSGGGSNGGSSSFSNYKTVRCKFFEQGKSSNTSSHAFTKNDCLVKIMNIFINTIQLLVTNIKFLNLGKNCPYGTRCSFAHGEQELRQAAPQMMPPPMPGFMGGYDMPNDMMYGGGPGGANPMMWDPSMMPPTGFQSPPMMDMMGGAGAPYMGGSAGGMPGSQFMGGPQPGGMMGGFGS